MAPLPSERANGEMILKIYDHFKVRPGEVLVSNNFLAWAGRNRIQIDDLKAGLAYAVEQGWIAEKPNGFLALTDMGFELM